MRLSLKLAALCLTAISALPASAATTVYTGTTVGGPTFNRPSATNSLSGVGTSVNYEAVGITVSQSGSYTFDLTSQFDNVLAFYAGTFNPASPLANIIGYNDDNNGTLNASLTADLLAGTSYFAVATAYSNGASGAFTLTANGPGSASFNGVAAAVPEPATWAMMLVGFGAMGVAFRRRRALTATARVANA